MWLKVNVIINAAISYCLAHVIFQCNISGVGFRGRRHPAPAPHGWSARLASPTIFNENNYPRIPAAIIAARTRACSTDSSGCFPHRGSNTTYNPQKNSRFVASPGRSSVYTVPFTAFICLISVLEDYNFQRIFFFSLLLKTFPSKRPRPWSSPCMSWRGSAWY